MATTTNYSWTTPDDTALVKDGAAAIRTLGSSIDTTTKNLNPSTTLGDIEYRSSTANTNTRLGIGSSGQVLTVAAGVPSWATPSGALSLAQIATGSITSGTDFTISSLSSYDTLILRVNNLKWNTDVMPIKLFVNNDTSSVYDYVGANVNENSTAGGARIDQSSFLITGQDANYPDRNNGFNFMVVLNNCKSTGFTDVTWTASYDATRLAVFNGIFKSAAAVSSLVVGGAFGYAFNTGTYMLHGG
jgi:hypothetical protein